MAMKANALEIEADWKLAMNGKMEMQNRTPAFLNADQLSGLTMILLVIHIYGKVYSITYSAGSRDGAGTRRRPSAACSVPVAVCSRSWSSRRD